MQPELKSGQFVHVVATVDTKAGEGKILYVNPATSTLVSDAVPEADVVLVVEDRQGAVLHSQEAVVRRASCEPGHPSDTGLIQADLPRVDGMSSVSLQIGGKEVSRYVAGAAPPVTGTATLGLAPADAAGSTKRELSIDALAGIAPQPGVTYSVDVKPDTGAPWTTIAIGRAVPVVDIDRNQFPGAKSATVRVSRSTGFNEEVVAEAKLDL